MAPPQITSGSTAAATQEAGPHGGRCSPGPLLCYAFLQRVSPSVMVEELIADFSASAAILGNLSAFYFYAYAALQFPWPANASRWSHAG